MTIKHFNIVIFIALLVSVSANAQETTPTPYSLAPSFHCQAFPVDLYCEDIDDVSQGASWGEVTIGVSSVEDLKRYVSTIEQYDVIQFANFIEFAPTESPSDESGIPLLIDACLDVETQTVTALRVSINRLMRIQDLVAVYGLPDIVTWGNSNIGRTAFWFEEGIAALVYILEQNDILDYGEIGLIVYFPYQTVEGFEERWPYDHTNSENPTGGDYVYVPTPSEEQDPFDFEATVAANTSEPSLTPSPVVFPPPHFGLPELICPYFRDVQIGYSWNGIAIGISTQEDLEALLEQFGRYEMVLPDEDTLANSIGYRWRESSNKGRAQQAPLRVDVCFQDTRIVVLDISWIYQRASYINDWVAIYGQPDVVTWSLVENLRMAFWFEEGIAVEVFVQYGDDASFGQITNVFYFPPQSSEGYETRWPFSITRMQPFYPADPSVLGEQNPFDFDAMIATITAEPTRTLTPTP